MVQVSEGANPYYRSVSAKGCVWGLATPPQQRKRMLTSEVLTGPEGGGDGPSQLPSRPLSSFAKCEGSGGPKSQLEGKKGFRIAQI